jgi:3-methyladenine DNA glycosylase AlkD
MVIIGRKQYPVFWVGAGPPTGPVTNSESEAVLQLLGDLKPVPLIVYSGSPVNMDPVIAQIRQELESHADPEIRKTSQRFFKEETRCYGMKTATVIAMAKQYWSVVKQRPKREIFALCEELYRSGYLEESFIVSNWAHALSGRYEREDLAVFKRWIDTWITNWASCDGFCNHTMGDFIEQYPEAIEDLKLWTQSQNRWMRRAAAVSLIVPAKHGMFLKESVEIADLLLTDGDDMVQKGYGWLLKEASRKHTGEIFSYVMKNKKVMPRTALRYAIELMPKDLKAEAMKKDW